MRVRHEEKYVLGLCMSITNGLYSHSVSIADDGSLFQRNATIGHARAAQQALVLSLNPVSLNCTAPSSYRRVSNLPSVWKK
jgi:hypothetical protein